VPEFNVLVSYSLNPLRRDYSGTFACSDEKHGYIESFDSTSFAQMLHKLSSILVANRDRECAVVLSRLEVEGSRYVLDQGTVALLISDPEAAIQSMHHPDTVVHVRDLEPYRQGLTFGSDTLASAFGHDIFFSVQGDEVECPGCGRWSADENTATDGVFHCRLCELSVRGDKTTKWLIVDIADLIAVAVHPDDRFYIPRKWNVGGPWIACRDLSEKYRQFVKESASC